MKYNVLFLILLVFLCSCTTPEDSEYVLLASSVANTRVRCPAEGCGGGSSPRNIVGAAAGLGLAAIIGDWWFGNGYDPPEKNSVVPKPSKEKLWHCLAVITKKNGTSHVEPSHSAITQKEARKRALVDCKRNGVSVMRGGGCRIWCSYF